MAVISAAEQDTFIVPKLPLIMKTGPYYSTHCLRTSEVSGAEDETRQILYAFCGAMKDHGLDFDHITAATVHVKNSDDAELVLKVWDEFFPTSVCPFVLEAPLGNDFVEIQFLLYKA